MSRIIMPPPRAVLTLDDAPEHGPVVTPVDWSAGDRAIAQYFWTSTDKDSDAWICPESEVRRVILFGMKADPVPHGTPFGHGQMTLLVERIDLATAEQLLRHRIQIQTPDGDSMGWLELSANISKKSLRYTRPGKAGALVAELFYVPRVENVRGQVGRPGHYTYEPLDPVIAQRGIDELTRHFEAGARLYDRLRDDGWAAEQARYALSTGLLTRMYMTTSYRNWFNWLVQRNDAHAQGEVQMVARQVEPIIAQCAPLTYQLWQEHGRRVI